MTKILVVDDNKSNRMFLSKLLKSNEYEVVEAVNGIEALACVKESKPNLIISDIMMPRMDGFTLLRELRKENNTKNIPLVFYTAYYVSEKDRELAMKLGASRYIIRPQEPTDLIEEIAIVLSEYEVGLIKTTESLIGTEEDYLRQYSERIAHKLEDKIIELEREINERKRAEEQITQQKEFLKNIFESLTHPFYVIDARDHTIIMANTAAYIGHLTPNSKCYALTHGRDMPCSGEHVCPLEEVKKTKKPAIIEHIHYDKNGKAINVEVHGYPIFNSEGNVIQMIEYCLDITERKKAEDIRLEKERLECVSRAKSEFLTTMSHELRTPLNAVIGFSELMKQKIPGELNEKQEHYIDNIIASGKHLQTLINDILDLSRIEAGKIELVLEKIPVPVALDETITLIKERAAKHNIKIKKIFDPQLDFIEADKQRFKQVLFNLLDNAIKFSKGEGGIMTISTKRIKNMALFSVSDTGIGIKEDDVGKLFQRFEQLESGRTRKYGGTGLGLAISKQLVELHGGQIKVESKFGEGSTFTFSLPLKELKVEEKK